MERIIRAVRHAKPEEMDLTPQGLDPVLCREGSEQAEKLALEPELAGLTIYASPLTRAVLTARQVRKKTGGRLVIANDLEAVRLKTDQIEKLGKLYRESHLNFYEFWLLSPSGMETVEIFFARIENALRKIMEQTEGDFVILAHGEVVLALKAIAEKKTLRQIILESYQTEYARIYRFKVEEAA